MADCPRWAGDHDEHECPACFDGIEAVVRAASEAARRGPPTRGDIAEWHKHAFRRVVPLAYYAGGYRQHDPKRICLGRNVAVDGIPGAHFVIVLDEMLDLVTYMRDHVTTIELGWDSRPLQETVVELAGLIGEAVARFIRIHPFLNGNGRTSRVLWAALLSRFGLPRMCSVVRRPGPPYGDLMQAAMAGDSRPMVLTVLRSLALGPHPTRALPQEARA